MTTEELEKKLKISNDTCIHCPTLELAKQVLSIFHQLGLRWKDDTHYTLNLNWDSYKENTVYYPFEEEFTSLEFAKLTGYKIIRAEEFIALHTEEEKFDLENYIPKGQLEGFPKEIIARMLDCQEEQGNPRNVTIFEKCIEAGMDIKGFFWDDTKEKFDFWKQVIRDKNFNLFFEKYPKKEDNQEFRIGDKVYDISAGKIGIVKRILNDISAFPIEVYYEDYGRVLYAHEGKFSSKDKYPRLLHYRDDYDYSVINFNNLPKRQEAKRWRAEKEGIYYYIRFYIEDWFYISATKEYNSYYDSINYNSGNYFQTKEEAQEVADKLNKYFQELINPTK